MTGLSDLQKRMYALHGDREMFEQAIGYAYEYMDNVYEREVFPTDEAPFSVEVTPIIGAHVGPNAVGMVAVAAKS